jgi:type I restriction enzyme S subunit
MNLIEQLIQEFSPNGVEHKALGDIGEFIRGQGLQKVDFVKEGASCIHYGQIYTFYKKYVFDTKSFVSTEMKSKLKTAPSGSLIITTTSENVIDVAKTVVWLGSGDVVFGGHACAFIHDENPGYLAYALETTEFQLRKNALVQGTKVKDISLKRLASLSIPLPPKEVQNAIVDILDKFYELETELEAELEARRMQFEHYRHVLMELDSYPEYSFDDICTRISSGGTPNRSRKDFFVGSIPWLRTQEVNFDEVWDTDLHISEEALSESSAKWVPENTVVIAMYGATAAKVAVAKVSLTTNQACANLELDPEVANFRFVFHYLMDNYQHLKSLGQGTQSNLNLQQIRSYKINVPPIEVQNDIAARLDVLFELSNSFSSGIPGELAARRKQYEYYLDQLLTFKEA